MACGRAAEVADVPHLREPTIALLQRIGWQGMASAEYKLDPRDGRYRLMEINGRCFLINGLPTRCGVNYPLLAWREHALREAVGAEANGWRGRLASSPCRPAVHRGRRAGAGLELG